MPSQYIFVMPTIQLGLIDLMHCSPDTFPFYQILSATVTYYVIQNQNWRSKSEKVSIEEAWFDFCTHQRENSIKFDEEIFIIQFEYARNQPEFDITNSESWSIIQSQKMNLIYVYAQKIKDYLMVVVHWSTSRGIWIENWFLIGFSDAKELIFINGWINWTMMVECFIDRQHHTHTHNTIHLLFLLLFSALYCVR